MPTAARRALPHRNAGADGRDRFSRAVIPEQIASALHLIVQQARMRDGSRRVINLTEIGGMEMDRINPAGSVSIHRAGRRCEGKVTGELRPTGLRPRFCAKLEAAGVKLGPRYSILRTSVIRDL